MGYCILADKLRSYIRPIKDVLPGAEHIQSQGITAEVNNNLSERLQDTFRDRIKTLRGLDSLKSGQHYLDGWVLQSGCSMRRLDEQFDGNGIGRGTR